MTAAEPIVRLEGVSKRFDEITAVQRLDLAIARGEFFVLLGPSGCGKSTTLRLIAGLETVSEGRVWIAGRDVTQDPPAARQISMVFQSYALFPHLNVAENVIFGLRVRRVPNAARREKLAHVLDLVGLAGLERRKPAELSGGQRQRVALARAIVADHPLCLMDEPLSNLDAKLRGEMRHEIRALQRRLDMTVIYVTHDQVEAMSMADRILLLRDGRIEQLGRPAELYEHPASAFAAGFVGSPPMSLIPLETLRAAGAARALAGLPDAALLGLRPEALRVVPRGAGLVRGRVATLDYLGADSVLGVDVSGQHFVVRISGYSPVTEDDEVELDWPAQAAHLFDRATGERLSPPLAETSGGSEALPASPAPARRHLGPSELVGDTVPRRHITKGG